VISLLVEGVLEQEQPEAMMIRLLLFLLLFCGPALARDDGRYANSPLKEWFNRLASGKTYVARSLTDMWSKIPTGSRAMIGIRLSSMLWMGAWDPLQASPATGRRVGA
jgi:hypothetical protein